MQLSRWRKLSESTDQQEVDALEVDRWMEAKGLERRVERISAWSCSTSKRVLAQRTGALR